MGRLFVCDPVCVLPFGHNAPALKYFKQKFSSHFSEVTALCSVHLPPKMVKEFEFEPFYNFYYHQFLTLSHVPEAVDLSLNCNDPGFVDNIEALATADARRLLDGYSITADDTILFPSVDFYGLIGLLNALAGRSAANQPAVYARFLGVMENATSSYRVPLKEFVARILEAQSLGARLSFSAEAPPYADELATLLQQPVSATPYPQVGNLLPMPELGPFVMYCPGSARADKGYFDLWQICRAVRQQDPTLNIRFVTQILPDSIARHWENYTSQLYALPGVELLPAIIDEDVMLEQYRKCHAVLLPYDTETYALRGSAVMMEATYFGRRILTVTGTGFADQVSYYGIGDVVPTVADLPAAILAMARQPRATLQGQAAQACHRFNSDAVSAYAYWLGFVS